MVGILPGIGDLISTALSSYIVWEARRLGLPRWKIARMIANVGLDATIGAVPLVGDLFDVAFKANRRNLKIIKDHLAKEGVHLGASGDPKVIEADYRVVERPR
jgi:hypothetical protein